VKTDLTDLGGGAAPLLAPGAAAPAPARSFLFLQGLPGPFFSRLAAALKQQGLPVHRILFNGGDARDWRHAGAIAWRGALADWPAFLDNQLMQLGITDVVLFNDARPLHTAARDVCTAHGITVHVFEDGYLRPNFITLERGGVNRNSPLPRRLDALVAAARQLPPLPPVADVPASFRRRALDGVRYELASALAARRYPGYRGHRPLPALQEGLGWLRRLARMPGERRRTARVLRRLQAPRCFLLPLQLDADTQLRLYSRYGGMAPALAEVVASFARAAPADSVLVVKQHPLDPGLDDWRAKAIALASAHGVADRVLYVEAGDVRDLLRLCNGLVTINSTTGMAALEQGVPVHVLGDAVYGIPGIIADGPLDDFWRRPGPVDTTAYQALRTVMRHQSLVHGGFHSDAGIALAIHNAVPRLIGQPC
jgi:capsular polysaccharide export protein